MKLVTRVQIRDEAGYISLHVNAFGEGMIPSILTLHPSIGK